MQGNRHTTKTVSRPARYIGESADQFPGNASVGIPEKNDRVKFQ